VCSVTIRCESHKTRLLESKMEIFLLLAGRVGYLSNTSSLIAIFKRSNRRSEDKSWINALNRRHER
jgi:hypothetical protein